MSEFHNNDEIRNENLHEQLQKWFSKSILRNIVCATVKHDVKYVFFQNKVIFCSFEKEFWFHFCRFFWSCFEFWFKSFFFWYFLMIWSRSLFDISIMKKKLKILFSIAIKTFSFFFSRIIVFEIAFCRF